MSRKWQTRGQRLNKEQQEEEMRKIVEMFCF